MRKVIISLFILLFAVSAAACQKTPESLIVIGKNNNKMIETANSLEDKSLTVGEQVSAPKSVKLNFEDQTGKLKFAVDADVSVPDARTAKIIRVTSHVITQEEVDRWTEVLFADETLYTLDTFNQMTKQEITELLLEAKKRLAELGEEKSGGVQCEFTERSDNEVVYAVSFGEADELHTAVESYEKQLQTAPDTRIFTETTNKLEPKENTGSASVSFAVPNAGGNGIRAFSAGNFGFKNSLSYSNRGESLFITNSNVLSVEEIDHARVNAGEEERLKLEKYLALPMPSISRERAISLAEDFLDKLSVKGYSVSRAEQAVSEPSVSNGLGEPMGNVLAGWWLEFRREIDGIPVSFSDPYLMVSSAEGRPWCYERIMLFVTDNGVAEVYIEEQNDIGKTLVENCKLMRFDEIMDVFKKMMPVQYNITAMGDALLYAEWNVTSVEFGYTRILEEYTDYTGLLVPTWSFYGSEKGTYAYSEPYNAEYSYSVNRCPILTVNAIDGSIIDRSKGY